MCISNIFPVIPKNCIFFSFCSLKDVNVAGSSVQGRKIEEVLPSIRDLEIVTEFHVPISATFLSEQTFNYLLTSLELRIFLC